MNEGLMSLERHEGEQLMTELDLDLIFLRSQRNKMLYFVTALYLKSLNFNELLIWSDLNI